MIERKNKVVCRSVTGKINPSPRLRAEIASERAEKEIQLIIDGIISEEYLTEITKENDLKKVKKLEIEVNTYYQSLLDINTFLPNLTCLVLNSSVIVSIRDLGVELNNLLSLSMNECNLMDLDGIGVLTGEK